MTATQESLANLAAQLTDTQDRETYAALISYFHSLPAQDEMLHLAQLLGFLSLLGQRVPAALGEFLAELRAQTEATGGYCAAVEERLARLPEEIVSAVDLETFAQNMGERIRQQLAAAGLQNTVTLLQSSTQDVSALSGEISAGLKRIAQEYKGVSASIAVELGKLTEASRQLRAHNAQLAVQERWNAGLWQGLLAMLLFLIGGLSGIAFEKRQALAVRGSDSPHVEHSQTSPKEAPRSARSKKEVKHLE